jgi:hypothetical protein
MEETSDVGQDCVSCSAMVMIIGYYWGFLVSFIPCEWKK